MRRPPAIQTLSQIATGASIIFIPNLSEDLGADNTIVGVIGAIYALALFVSSYIFGRESDVHDRRIFIKIGLGLSIITFLLQALSDPIFFAPLLIHPWLLALIRFLTGFTAGMVPAALTAYVYDSKGQMGRFSAYGSLGSGLGSLLAGFIAIYWGIFVLSSLCFAVAFAISLTLPGSSNVSLKVSFFPTALMKRNWYVYASFFLRNFGANAIWAVYPLFIAQLGGDKFWTGIILTTNWLAQFVIMSVLDRFNSRKLLGAGLLLSAAAFVAFTFAQNFYQLIPMQLLLASAWSTLYVGALVFLIEHNVEKATCSGILNSTSNLSVVFGSLLGGIVSQFFGYVTTMYTAAAVTLIGYVLFRIGVRSTIRESPSEGARKR
ncbi:MAG: MFS transporter [Promethearchaeati archaeon SRVP18_Atabeyarchaeia-1]